MLVFRYESCISVSSAHTQHISSGVEMSSPIRFFHASQLHTVSDQPVTRTLLQYLREDAHCTSVKEGCAEGDCGACTVVVGELCNGELQMRSANACLLPLASLHGKAVFTADQLGDEQKPHPLQEAMVSCHGSQCGFCTPGFMMSMWSVYLQRDNRGCPRHAKKSSKPYQVICAVAPDTVLSSMQCRLQNRHRNIRLTGRHFLQARWYRGCQ
jgi:xanthine dehydrogenase iron-sulfur cluster and FAD-binding subunit A